MTRKKSNYKDRGRSGRINKRAKMVWEYHDCRKWVRHGDMEIAMTSSCNIWEDEPTDSTRTLWIREVKPTEQ